MVAGLIVFGLAVSFAVAVVAIWSVAIFRRTSAPLYSAWLNKGLKPELRATIISMRGQLDAIGQFVGGPIIGVVALGLGLRAAFVGVGLMLLPAIWLYGRTLKYCQQRATIAETRVEGD
jgi:DHA3 family tetracycline resistance protein-like MFS transporter